MSNPGSPKVQKSGIEIKISSDKNGRYPASITEL